MSACRYSVTVFLVPLCVLLYTYLQICWTLYRYAGLPEGSAHQRLISRAKLNTVKQTVAVILLYVVCSSPFICAQLWASWSPHFMAVQLPSGEGSKLLSLTARHLSIDFHRLRVETISVAFLVGLAVFCFNKAVVLIVFTIVYLIHVC